MESHNGSDKTIISAKISKFVIKEFVIMTKSELIEKMATQCPHLQIKDIELSVKVILEAMAAQLVQNDRIEIRGFGSFSTVKHRAHTGRNPKNGDSVYIPEKQVVHFKPGLELKEMVIDKGHVKITD